MLEALNYVDRLKNGETLPLVFLCQNGNEVKPWVLKLQGRVPTYELAADFIGCVLALRLEIATPRVEIARVSAEALSGAPSDIREWARPGPAFASEMIVNVQAAIYDHIITNLENQDNSNADFFGRLYALDTWLEVLDRCKPDRSWNLLLDLDTNGLCVIDFGKCLAGCFGMILSTGSRRWYPDYPESVLRIANKDEALRVYATIQEIVGGDLSRIVSAVPSDWLDDAARARVTSYLASRVEFVRTACDRLGEDR